MSETDLSNLPFQDYVDLGVAGHDHEEGAEEDLAVEDGVIEILALDGWQAKQLRDVLLCDVFIPDRGAQVTGEVQGGGQVTEEIFGCALVEILLWVFENSEDEGLGTGRDKGSNVGKEDHHPDTIGHVNTYSRLYKHIKGS